MVKHLINSIIVLNAFLLVVLIAGIRSWQRKHGVINEKTLSLIVIGYFSFSTITTSLPLMTINIQATIIINLIFLLVFWGIGYPWARWLYRKSHSPRRQYPLPKKTNQKAQSVSWRWIPVLHQRHQKLLLRLAENRHEKRWNTVLPDRRPLGKQKYCYRRFGQRCLADEV